MEAIMISDRPKWCALMMNGIKKIEIRKNKALAGAIQKLIQKYGYAEIYVYCTKDKKETKPLLIKHCSAISNNPLNKYETRLCNGKVLFKFRCYNVEEIKPKVKFGLLHTYNTYETETFEINPLLNKCCLSYEELDSYLKLKVGYAIHIECLEIFDRPKELSEFSVRVFPNRKGNLFTRYLTKAPQNMVYVEAL